MRWLGGIRIKLFWLWGYGIYLTYASFRYCGPFALVSSMGEEEAGALRVLVPLWQAIHGGLHLRCVVVVWLSWNRFDWLIVGQRHVRVLVLIQNEPSHATELCCGIFSTF